MKHVSNPLTRAALAASIVAVSTLGALAGSKGSERVLEHPGAASARVVSTGAGVSAELSGNAVTGSGVAVSLAGKASASAGDALAAKGRQMVKFGDSPLPLGRVSSELPADPPPTLD